MFCVALSVCHKPELSEAFVAIAVTGSGFAAAHSGEPLAHRRDLTDLEAMPPEAVAEPHDDFYADCPVSQRLTAVCCGKAAKKLFVDRA